VRALLPALQNAVDNHNVTVGGLVDTPRFNRELAAVCQSSRDEHERVEGKVCSLNDGWQPLPLPLYI
jgi:hypothetical protein